MQTAQVATFPRFLWEGNTWSGEVAGLPARATNNVTDNRVMLGDFTKLSIGVWGEAIEIFPDPFTKKGNAVVDFFATLYADSGLAGATNAAVSTDSGAQ